MCVYVRDRMELFEKKKTYVYVSYCHFLHDAFHHSHDDVRYQVNIGKWASQGACEALLQGNFGTTFILRSSFRSALSKA